jgi:hypothetical protein
MVVVMVVAKANKGTMKSNIFLTFWWAKNISFWIILFGELIWSGFRCHVAFLNILADNAGKEAGLEKKNKKVGNVILH